jgi:predicted ABC-type ATPase
MPEIYIIAGCNGAGKTTAAYTLLPEVFKTIEFVNADEIARGLSPFNVEGVAFQAGRIMLERIDQLIKEQKSFAFETTLAGLSYLKLIKDAKAVGYEIIFFFVYLNNVELAKNRVAIRVSKGGHDISADVIERRYFKGIRNLKKYAAISNDWYIYDNSRKTYELIAKSISGQTEILNFELVSKLISYETY